MRTLGTKVALDAIPRVAADVLFTPEEQYNRVSYYVEVGRSACNVQHRFVCSVFSVNPDPYFIEYSYLQFGWPMVSMQYEVAGDTWWPEQVPGWRGGWPLSPSRWPLSLNRNRSTPPKHVYPLVPLPLGFTLNTLFYAALLFLPFATFTTLRRRRRIRRNLCPSCGYSLAGAIPTNNTITCPECGKSSVSIQA